MGQASICFLERDLLNSATELVKLLSEFRYVERDCQCSNRVNMAFCV